MSRIVAFVLLAALLLAVKHGQAAEPTMVEVPHV